MIFLDCDDFRESFRNKMVIEFCVGEATNQWNLQMARMITQLWEMVQLVNIHSLFSTAEGDISRVYLRLEDYRMNCK